MTSWDDYDFNESYFHEYEYEYEKYTPPEFIGRLMEPTFIYAGTVLNIMVFCIWMFGPKSKSLCCATYFSANAVADFLLLTIRPIIRGTWIIRIPYRKTDIVCKLEGSLLNSTLQVSTWISATITVERALTIILPYVFKSQDMSRRSKYIIAMIIVMQPFTQIFVLLNMTTFTDPDEKKTQCTGPYFHEMPMLNPGHIKGARFFGRAISKISGR